MKKSESGKLFRELCLFIRCVVLVQNTLRNSGVDRGDCLGIESSRLFLIARFHGCKELFDLCFERRLHGFVLEGLFFGDKDAFFSGFDVGHDISPS